MNAVIRLGLCGVVLVNLGIGLGFAVDDPQVKFHRVGSEIGPPPEVITAILQDCYGFVWIGSREGLSRYDGETFVTYRYDPDDPGSISDNSVRAIFEDRSGHLWLGTNSGGLNRLDRATGRFEHFRHRSADSASLSHDSVYAIAQDNEGTLWVATQMGLNRFDEKTGTFSRFVFDADDAQTLSHNYITCLLVDSQNRIWLGTNGGGLNLMDQTTGRFTRFLSDKTLPNRLSLNQVFSLCEDETGALWVGGQGLFRMDPETGVFESIDSSPDDPSAFEVGLVVSLAAAKNGSIWVGTFGRGLHTLDLTTSRSRSYRHDPVNRNSLGEDKVMALVVDSTDNIWIGTWGAGVWRLTYAALQIANAAKDIAAPEKIRNTDVTGLGMDAKDRLWVGTRFGDLMRKDPGRPGFRQFHSTSGTINDIEETDDGMIWVGKAGGLERLNLTTGTITYFKHDPQIASSIGSGYVTALLEDRQDQLWVGTGEGGLQRLDSKGQIVERFLHDPIDPHSLSDNYVKSLVQDFAGTIWVGTRSGGLNAFDPFARQWRRFLPDPEDSSSISYHSITTIFQDSRKRLWIGTDGGGLNEKKTRDDGSVYFEQISSADGLIDDAVMGILEDDDGSLWLSTKRGLSRFDPESKNFSQLYVGDGLPAGAFEPGAAARTNDTLYFGSVRWLVALPAGTPFPQHLPSPVVITSIRDIHGELVGKNPSWLRTHLEVPFNSWFALTLAVIDFNVEHHHRFQYRLGDEDDPWVDLGPQREITFLDLDPGTHEFSARAHNCQGVWNDLPQTLTIHVPPPFWMTVWFRAGVFFMITGLVLAGHRIRTLTLRRRHLELIGLHRQREKAQAKLSQAYDQLRKLTRRLEGTKEEERQRIARELHDEMGPALTAVIINLQLAINNTDAEVSNKRLTDSIEMVDRMVEQIRDLSLALRPPLLDEVGFLPAIRGYLETQAARTGVKIKINSPPDLTTLPAEVEITAFRVIQEAVSNVIRHAKSTMTIVSIEFDDSSLNLSIQDDGVGFNPTDIVDTAAPRESLGLVGMQERVQILGGEFSINAELGHGTTVEVRIPVEVRS